MFNSRVATLSLALAVAVFALGYVNPSAAKPDPCVPNDPEPPPRCKPKPGDDPNALTYKVDLRGTPISSFVMQGAFEFHPAGASSPASATLDSKGLTLTGVEPVTLKRAGSDEDCMSGTQDVMDACTVWTDVFNLCGLLGPWDEGGPDDGSGPTKLNEFTAELGKWSLSKGGGRRTISFGFTIPPAQSNGTERDMSGSLQLYSACSDPVNDPSCEGDAFIPTAAGAMHTVKFVVDNASVHLRGKGGVTHNAVCHADDDVLEIENGASKGSTIVITAE